MTSISLFLKNVWIFILNKRTNNIAIPDEVSISEYWDGDEKTVFFDENQNLAGLIGLNNGSTVGLCRGLVEKGRKDVVLVGFDYSDDIAALIEDGEYQVSTMVQRQYNMGYGSVESAIDICNGNELMYKFVNTGISKVDHGNYDSTYVKNKVLLQ